MQKWDRNDQNALFTLEKITALQQPFFSGIFLASRFFSGGFLANAENIPLGG